MGILGENEYLTGPPTSKETLDFKRNFSQAERDKLANQGEAMPDGSYPIPDKGALRRAIQSIGRAKNYEATKRHIIKRARALGALDMLPDDWKPSEGKILMERLDGSWVEMTHDEFRAMLLSE